MLEPGIRTRAIEETRSGVGGSETGFSALEGGGSHPERAAALLTESEMPADGQKMSKSYNTRSPW